MVVLSNYSGMILTFRMPSEKVRKAGKLLLKITLTTLCILYIFFPVCRQCGVILSTYKNLSGNT